MAWFRRSGHKIKAAEQERSARTMVDFSYRIWSPEDRVHLLNQTVRVPLPDARVLRAELDAAIGTAEARLGERDA